MEGGGFVRQTLLSDCGKDMGHEGQSHPSIPGSLFVCFSREQPENRDLKGLS